MIQEPSPLPAGNDRFISAGGDLMQPSRVLSDARRVLREAAGPVLVEGRPCCWLPALCDQRLRSIRDREKLPPRSLPRCFPRLNTPARRDPTAPPMMNQQHPGERFVEHPHLCGKRLRRPLAVGDQPLASAVELDFRQPDIGGCGLDHPVVEHITSHRGNIRRRSDTGVAPDSARVPATLPHRGRAQHRHGHPRQPVRALPAADRRTPSGSCHLSRSGQLGPDTAPLARRTSRP